LKLDPRIRRRNNPQNVSTVLLKEAVISSLVALFSGATALKASAPKSHKIKMSDGVFERWYRRHRLSIINRVSFSFSSYFPFTNNHAVDRRTRVGGSLFYGDWQNWHRWLFCPVHIARQYSLIC
jgi:hypothetical protein